MKRGVGNRGIRVVRGIRDIRDIRGNMLGSLCATSKDSWGVVFV